MLNLPDALNERFGIPDMVRFDAGAGGLPRLVVTSGQADAHIYLHGAHVTHYQPCGQAAVLFVSERSPFELDKSIRGGVPVVFPWFGPHPDDADAPLHGFARVREWGLRDVVRRDSDGAVVATFGLHALAHAPQTWPQRFELTYAVTIGPALEMALTVRNEDAKPIRFEEALHSYFLVGDVRRIAIRGLTGATYADKTRGFQRFVDDADPLTISAATDRVYRGTRSTCTIDDPLIGRRIIVEKDASDTTVVWNPWAVPGDARPADLAAGDWQQFLCIETANARDHAITLAPGATHTMRATIRTQEIPR